MKINKKSVVYQNGDSAQPGTILPPKSGWGATPGTYLSIT